MSRFRLQWLHRRELPLVRPRKGGIADMDRLKETFGPTLRFQRLQHYGLAIVTHANSGSRNVVAFRQAHGLALPLVYDGCGFHNNLPVRLLCLSRISNICLRFNSSSEFERKMSNFARCR